MECGPTGAVRVSEFAESRPVSRGDQAYRRPANKRDLGHLCHRCRRPFNSLGMEIVAELHGGPSVRYHTGCWRQCKSGRQPRSEPVTRLPTPELESGPHVSVEEEEALMSEPLIPSNVVLAYAEEWRRSQLSRIPRRLPEGSRRDSLESPPVTQGLVSVEDSSGQRKISVGFSQRELDVARSRWSCTVSTGSECAICFQACSKPLRLPCKHMFCGLCVEPWLRKCALCPMCRRDLRRSPDVKQAEGPIVVCEREPPLTVRPVGCEPPSKARSGTGLPCSTIPTRRSRGRA